MEENEKLIPKRRFKEFQNTQAWEQRKLGDMADIVRGASPRPIKDPKWFDYESDIGWLRISDVTEQDGRIHYLEQRLSVSGQEKTRILTEPHLLLSIAATVGKSVINYVKTGVHDGFLIFQNPVFDREFMFQWLEMFRPKWSKYGQPGSQVNLNSDLVKDKTIMMPEVAEQTQIGQFFAAVDNLITLHQRKLEKTKALKTAYLSEMFPAEGESEPKCRFAGFTDAWEQRGWKDTVDISTDMVDPRTGKYDNLLHIGPGSIESFSGRLFDNVNTVKEDNLISGKFYFKKGDVIYGKINPQLGKYIYAPFEGLASADAYVLNAKNGLDQTFLFTLLQTRHFFKYSISVSMRSGMPKINRDELNEYYFNVPSLQEQERIGGFFLDLDNLITLHQRKLEKLQNIKKAYLNEMFI